MADEIKSIPLGGTATRYGGALGRGIASGLEQHFDTLAQQKLYDIQQHRAQVAEERNINKLMSSGLSRQDATLALIGGPEKALDFLSKGFAGGYNPSMNGGQQAAPYGAQNVSPQQSEGPSWMQRNGGIPTGFSQNQNPLFSNQPAPGQRNTSGQEVPSYLNQGAPQAFQPQLANAPAGEVETAPQQKPRTPFPNTRLKPTGNLLNALQTGATNKRAIDEANFNKSWEQFDERAAIQRAQLDRQNKLDEETHRKAVAAEKHASATLTAAREKTFQAGKKDYEQDIRKGNDIAVDFEYSVDKALGLMDSPNINWGGLSRLKPVELLNAEEGAITSVFNEIVNKRVQLGKGNPSVARLLREEAAKANIGMDPETVRFILQSAKESPTVLDPQLKMQSYNDVIKKYNGYNPDEFKSLVDDEFEIKKERAQLLREAPLEKWKQGSQAKRKGRTWMLGTNAQGEPDIILQKGK